MSAASEFLNLPQELRDQIYEYVSLSCGAYLTPNSNGTAISPSSLLLVCRRVSEEYKSVIQSTAPVITARVLDFDFSHVVKFLDDLLSTQTSPAARTAYASLKRPSIYRRLELALSLTPDSRQHLDKLEAWLDRTASQPTDHYSTSFTTTYAVHDSTTAAPITFMRMIDEIHCNWYLRASSGARKDEIGKVTDCLGEAEQRINRMRTKTIPSGPRMGGLEIF